LEGIIPKDRFAAENGYIQKGENWKPYFAYNFDCKNNNYSMVNFKKELYR